MIAPFDTETLHWFITHKHRPQEGYAIVWIAPDGRQIDGCMIIEAHKGVLTTQREFHFLPLKTYDDDHQADTPIDYIPGLWRYK
jgi:hypothetical protein